MSEQLPYGGNGMYRQGAGLENIGQQDKGVSWPRSLRAFAAFLTKEYKSA